MGKGKKSMKGGKKESYDLIVNIDLEEWKLTPEQVRGKTEKNLFSNQNSALLIRNYINELTLHA